MKLKWKDIFSVRLYVEGLKKIRLSGIAAAITVIVLNAILPLIAIMESEPGYTVRKTVITYPHFIPFGAVMMIFAVIMVHSMFSFLNERKDSDFYHSIPQKRICVYLSFLAAILTWIFGILAASSLMNAVLWGITPDVVYPAAAPFLSVLVLFLAAAMVGAFMTLAMMLTGTNVSNYLIFTLFLLFVRVVGGMFVSTLADILPIFDVSYSFWRIFDWEFFLPFATFFGVINGDASAFTAPIIVYSIVVTLALYAIAGLCYVKRRSEMATKSAPNAIMQHVYRCAVTYPFLLILAMLGIMDGLDFATLLIWVAIALLVYVIFELMTTKKIKNALKSLPLFLVPVAMTFVFTFAVYGTQNAVLNNVPKANEIRSIGFYSDTQMVVSYNDLRVDKIAIENEQAKGLVEDVLEYASNAIKEGYYNRAEYYKDSETTRVNLEIKLKSGRTIGRRVRMRMTDLETLQQYFMSSPEYREASLSLPEVKGIRSMYIVDAYFDDSDAVDRLWASFISEYGTLSDTEKQMVINYPYSYSTSSLAQLSVVGTYEHKAYQSTYPISVIYTPKTAQLYLELLYDTPEYIAQTKRLRELCEDMQKSDFIDYINCSINLSVLMEEGRKDVHLHLNSDDESKIETLAPAFEIILKAMEREPKISEGIPVCVEYWLDVNKGQTSSLGYSSVSEYHDGRAFIMITESEYEALLALQE